MSRTCVACGQRPAATTWEWPALCQPCLDRAGNSIEPGTRVVSTVSTNYGGTVDRLADETLAVVRTGDGKEAWMPIHQLVRATF